LEQPLTGSGADYAELAPLLGAVHRKHGNTGTDEQMEFYLASTARTMGDAGSALVLYADARAVACSLLWKLPSEWHVRAWGCDYAAVGRDGTYFNLNIYEPAARAQACGVRRLYLGPDTIEAKCERGARAEPLHTILVR
jgi:hypothetical protein